MMRPTCRELAIWARSRGVDIFDHCMHARYFCSRDAVGLKAVKAEHAAGRPSATIGYLVYKFDEYDRRQRPG